MNLCSHYSRRKFVTGLVASAGILSQWRGAPALAQGGFSGDPNSVLPLRLADFPALAQVGGSVMLTYDAGTTVLFIIRGSGNAVYVLDPTCPHAGCTVDKYDAAASRIACPCHGSTFAIDGALTRGPANEGLRPYASQLVDGIITVELPSLEFGITSIAPVLTTGGAGRVALTFPTRNRAAYRLRRSTTTAGTFLPVSFALAKDNALSLTELQGDGGVKTVYADASAPRSFFRLELRVFEIG